MAHPALLAALVLAVVVAGWTGLYLDGRRQRNALGGAQTALGALRRQVVAQGEQIGSLTRALALLVPADARPTTALQRPADQALAARRADLGGHPIVGLSRPFVPSPRDVALARTAAGLADDAERLALAGGRTRNVPGEADEPHDDQRVGYDEEDGGAA